MLTAMGTKATKERHSWSLDGTLVVKRRHRGHAPSNVHDTQDDIPSPLDSVWVVGRRPADDPSSPFVHMCSCATARQVVHIVRNMHLLPNQPHVWRGDGTDTPARAKGTIVPDEKRPSAKVPAAVTQDKNSKDEEEEEKDNKDEEEEKVSDAAGGDAETSEDDGASSSKDDDVPRVLPAVDRSISDRWLLTRINSLTIGGRIEFSLDDRSVFCVDCVPALCDRQAARVDPLRGGSRRTKAKKWADAAYTAYVIICCLLALAYLVRLLRR